MKDDRKRIPLDVKAGDRILFGKYAGQEIKLDGAEYLIMKEDDVLAVPSSAPVIRLGTSGATDARFRRRWRP